MNEQKNPIVQAMEEALENVQLKLPDMTCPDPSTINYYVFETDRKLFLETDVGYPIMEMIKLIMRWNQEDKDVPVEQRKPIIIYIMSDGGSLAYMWSMIDAMIASKTPIYTVNLGIAASAAALIFLAGSKRYMMPTAMTIIHEGSVEMAGDANKVFDAANNYSEEIKKMRDYILKRTSIPTRLMNKKQKDDWYIDAKTCMEHGVCHHVVESLDEIV